MRRVLPRLALLLSAFLLPVVAPSGSALAGQAVDGPDVASYQHPNGAGIDWGAVARSGRSFAFVKATEATSYTNPWFTKDWTGIASAGLVRGSYHYARPALPISTAVDQAKYYISVTGTTQEKGDLPPALDLEEDGGLTPGQLVTWAQVWLDTVRSLTGRTPIIYTYRWYWQHYLLNSAALTRYPLWIAEYNNPSGPSTPLIGGWQTWAFWQFTSSAQISGIPTAVDMSNYNGTADQLATFADGTAATPWPVSVPAAPVALDAGLTDKTGQVAVSWVPGDNGGALVQSYTVTANPGGQHVTVDGNTTTGVIGGLSVGTSYTFTVMARNGAGYSPSSAASNAVTPLVPTSFASSLTPSQVQVGGRPTMTAKLYRSDNGVPLTGRTLAVYTHARGTTAWTQVTTITTDSNGYGRWPWPVSRSTDVFFRYAGEPGWAPAQTYTRTVTAVPAVFAKLSVSKVIPYHNVAISGTSAPRRPGALVYLQQYYGGAWHTATRTNLQSDGTYRFVVRPKTRATYLYRIVLPGTTSFGVGISPRLALRVI